MAATDKRTASGSVSPGCARGDRSVPQQAMYSVGLTWAAHDSTFVVPSKHRSDMGSRRARNADGNWEESDGRNGTTTAGNQHRATAEHPRRERSAGANRPRAPALAGPVDKRLLCDPLLERWDAPPPAFSDWRVAYIGADQRVRAVSLDGNTGVAGATVPVPGTDATGLWAAGTSRDGKHLAYYSGARLTLLDAASGVRRTYFPVAVGENAPLWSPDQRYIALSDTGYVMCVSVADGSTKDVLPPQTGPNGIRLVSRPFGWLDATHVALQNWMASSANAASFQSLDVITGQLCPIATIQTDENAPRSQSNRVGRSRCSQMDDSKITRLRPP